MSPTAQPLSAVAPVSDIVREEIAELLADLREPIPVRDGALLSMDLVEIAQEHGESIEIEDEIDILRVSPAVPV